MSLEIAPEVEVSVRRYAEEEGMSVNDLLARHFPPRAVARDTRASVQALLAQWQQEYGLPQRPDGQKHSSLAELSEEWAQEDAYLPDAERQAEREFWEQRERERAERAFQL